MDEELRDFMKESRDFHLESAKVLGGLQASQDNLTEFIKAVSVNTKDNRIALDAHKDDSKAHGIGTLMWLAGGILTVVEVAAKVLFAK